MLTLIAATKVIASQPLIIYVIYCPVLFQKSTLDTDKARIPVVVIGISVTFNHAIISLQFRSNWINFETPEDKYLEILAKATE